MSVDPVLPGTGPLAAGGHRLVALAAEVRRHAVAVTAAGADSGWRSTAASACRARLEGLGLDLLGTAALLEHAAAVLDDHARTVARRAAVLEQAASDLLLTGARDVVGWALS